MNRNILTLFLLAAVPASLSFMPSVQTSAAPGVQINRVMVFRAYPYEVSPGGVVTLDGSGFSRASNKVYLNETEILSANSANGTSMTFILPSSVYEGTYSVSISNILGSSSDRDIPVSIKVTALPQTAPVILSAFLNGSTITLTGSGFTSSNSIVTTLGNLLTHISANGDILTFNLADLSMYNQVVSSHYGRKIPVSLWIYVQNERGINRNPYKLDITI